MKIWWWLIGCACLLAACSEEPKKEHKEPDWDRLTKADEIETKSTMAKDPALVSVNGVSGVHSTSQGGVTVTIRPEQPGSEDCLRAIVQGQPGRTVFQWFVNGEAVSQHIVATLCGDYFKRGDVVKVHIGTNDVGASTVVSIVNTPPEIVAVTISNEPLPVGELAMIVDGADADGDEIEYIYQWLINGEEDPLQIESSLSADSYAPGDTVEVIITPFDGIDVGSPSRKEIVLPGESLQITSQPEQNFKANDYIYQVVVEGTSDTITYRLENAPEGMEINPETGLIHWSLVDVSPDIYDVKVVVNDSEGKEATQSFNVNLLSPE